MAAHRPFGRRTPGMRASARAMQAGGSAPQNRAHLERAYSETEDYARSLVAQQREARSTARSGVWIGGLAVVLALGLALPHLGTGPSGPAPMTVAELDALTPEQLANLAPAAGGETARPSLLERIVGALTE